MFYKIVGEKGYIRTTGGYVTPGGGKRRIFLHSVQKYIFNNWSKRVSFSIGSKRVHSKRRRKNRNKKTGISEKGPAYITMKRQSWYNNDDNSNFRIYIAQSSLCL